MFMKGTPFSKNSSIPVNHDFYGPVLKELEEHGVVFREKVEELDMSVSGL